MLELSEKKLYVINLKFAVWCFSPRTSTGSYIVCGYI